MQRSKARGISSENWWGVCPVGVPDFLPSVARPPHQSLGEGGRAKGGSGLSRRVGTSLCAPVELRWDRLKAGLQRKQPDEMPLVEG